MSIAATGASSGIDFSQFKSQQIAKKRSQETTSTESKKPQDIRDLLHKEGVSRYEQFQIQSTMVMQSLANSHSIDFNTALQYHTNLDTDKNGLLDKAEVQNGALDGSNGEQQYFASNLQSSFDAVSGLDGAAGVSRMDIAKLGSSGRGINALDFYKAANPDAYQSQMNQVSQLYKSLESKYGVILA